MTKFMTCLYFLVDSLLLLSSVIDLTESQTQSQAPNTRRFHNSSVSALFVFGDSTVDSGNNNFLPNALLKSNFPPYGRDFLTHNPTGRFSNGRLVTDFIASYAGLKETIPPYLDGSVSEEERMTGVSFASAGSGYDPLTPKLTGVMDMATQLDIFRDYLKGLQLRIGKKQSQELVRKATITVSAGTNDYVVNYFTVPFQQLKYPSVEDYQLFLLSELRVLLQELRDLRFRKFLVAGLPPMGCLPLVITLKSPNGLGKRSCIDWFNAVAKQHNARLQSELTALQSQMSSEDDTVKIAYANIYNPLLDMAQSSHKFGFEETMSGCCGTGWIETSFLCNSKSVACTDASKYVYFDSIHPTEKTYYNIFNTLRQKLDELLRD